MLTPFRSLILPLLEYCCIFSSPSKAGEICDLESIQRSFTAKIESVKHLNYWDHLKSLRLYSLERRRRERYLIIYTWKILVSLVSNFFSESSKIDHYWSDRLGRKCKTPTVRNLGGIGNKRGNFLSVKGPRLFNVLPSSIRSIMDGNAYMFNRKLDSIGGHYPR